MGITIRAYTNDKDRNAGTDQNFRTVGIAYSAEELTKVLRECLRGEFIGYFNDTENLSGLEGAIRSLGLTYELFAEIYEYPIF